MAKDAEKSNYDELFLDTTYLFPFFQVPIKVEDFVLSDFKRLVSELSKVHVAELSVYEAKAKLARLSRGRTGYEQALQGFARNLEALRLDDKFVFHSYDKAADECFNQLLPLMKSPDAFDLIILSQAFAVGYLLTEDEDLLALRDSSRFAQSQLSKIIRIRCWKERSQKG